MLLLYATSAGSGVGGPSNQCPRPNRAVVRPFQGHLLGRIPARLISHRCARGEPTVTRRTAATVPYVRVGNEPVSGWFSSGDSYVYVPLFGAMMAAQITLCISPRSAQ